MHRLLRAENPELPALGWAFAYFFLLLASYYLLRPVRDALAVEAGTQQLQWLFTATFVAMLVLVPVFGWLCSRLPRARQPRAEPAEHGDEDQHGDEGRGEEPLQLLRAGLDRQRVAHRAQEVVARQEQEKVREGPAERGKLVVLRAEEPVHAPVSYTHLRAHETPEHLVCRLLLEK